MAKATKSWFDELNKFYIKNHNWSLRWFERALEARYEDNALLPNVDASTVYCIQNSSDDYSPIVTAYCLQIPGHDEPWCAGEHG